MEQDADWVNKDGTLNTNFYFHDYVHLNHQGNKKFANTIINKLKDICSSPTSSDIILKIPSSEAPQHLPFVSSLTCPTASQPMPIRLPEDEPPPFETIPKSVYDHNKQILSLSSS